MHPKSLAAFHPARLSFGMLRLQKTEVCLKGKLRRTASQSAIWYLPDCRRAKGHKNIQPLL
jgi:hypothetical protein